MKISRLVLLFVVINNLYCMNESDNTLLNNSCHLVRMPKEITDIALLPYLCAYESESEFIERMELQKPINYFEKYIKNISLIPYTFGRAARPIIIGSCPDQSRIVFVQTQFDTESCYRKVDIFDCDKNKEIDHKFSNKTFVLNKSQTHCVAASISQDNKYIAMVIERSDNPKKLFQLMIQDTGNEQVNSLDLPLDYDQVICCHFNKQTTQLAIFGIDRQGVYKGQIANSVFDEKQSKFERYLKKLGVCKSLSNNLRQ